MNHRQYPYRHRAHLHQQHGGYPPEGPYQNYGYPVPVDPQTPYPEQQYGQLPPQQGTGTGGGGFLGGGRAGQMVGELQNFINRMGGIDGILSTVGKMQKLMSTVQQITPMLSLLLKKKGTGSDLSADTPRRRSTRRTNRRPRSSRSSRTSRSRSGSSRYRSSSRSRSHRPRR